MTTNDEQHIRQFMAFMSRMSGDRHEIAEIIKVDLRQLVAVQQVVITERSKDYASMSVDADSWTAEFLPYDWQPAHIGMRVTVGMPYHSHPLSSTILYTLPNAEFAFLPRGNGTFGISELPRYVTVCREKDWVVLKNGYHRSLARILHADGAAPTALVALEKIAPTQSAESQVYSVNRELPIALVGDYTTEGLYMDVLLRRKRYQIEVRARWMAVDDE